MFGLFKSKDAPSGPVEFTLAEDIACPPEHAYALLDWADPRNARVAAGHLVEPMRGRDCYRLHRPELPDHHFLFTVTDARPFSHYAYQCDILPQTGPLLRAQESWRLQQADAGCHLTVQVHALFEEGLSERDFSRAVARLSLDCQDRLAHLKRLAQQGAGVAGMAESVHVSHISVAR